MPQSEIMRLREQIDAELLAARCAIYDPSLGTAKHAYITARMERAEVHRQKLERIVGPEKSIEIMAESMDSTAHLAQRDRL